MQLVSTPLTTRISASVRGNLGPPSVMLSNVTSDWLKDRWQAASDMHGTAIHGPHWVLLEFFHDQQQQQRRQRVSIQRVVLDWESAYSDDYQVLGIMDSSSSNETVILYDTKTTTSQAAASVSDLAVHSQPTTLPTVTTLQWGQSPGVEFKCPLHIQHTIDWAVPTPLVSALRLVIRKPAQHGWGVSLWRIQVYGYTESSIG